MCLSSRTIWLKVSVVTIVIIYPFFVWVVVWVLFCLAFHRTDGCRAPKQQWVLVAFADPASLQRGTRCLLLRHCTLSEKCDLVRAQPLNLCLRVHCRMLHHYEQLPFHNTAHIQSKHQVYIFSHNIKRLHLKFKDAGIARVLLLYN